MNKNSRPTTPHRLSSRSSILPQSPKIHYPIDPDNLPLESLINANIFAELSDSLGDFDLNMKNLQIVHESLNTFNESFASFLYGLQMNAWCIEFIEAPNKQNFDRINDNSDLEQRVREAEENLARLRETSHNLQSQQLQSTLQQQQHQTQQIQNQHQILQPKPHLAKVGSRIQKPTRRGTKILHQQNTQDDSYTNSEASFIIQPKTKLPQPNLNQPPRYMQNDPSSRIPSLAAPPATFNRKKRIRETKKSINNRPPFR